MGKKHFCLTLISLLFLVASCGGSDDSTPLNSSSSETKSVEDSKVISESKVDESSFISESKTDEISSISESSVSESSSISESSTPIIEDSYDVYGGSFKFEDSITSLENNSIAFNSKDTFEEGTLSVDIFASSATDNGIVFLASFDKGASSIWEGNGISYYFYFISLNGTAYLGKTVDGGWQICKDVTIPNFDRSNTYTLEVSLDRSNEEYDYIVCSLNGDEMFSYTDDEKLSGVAYGYRAGGKDVVYSKISKSSDKKIYNEAKANDYYVASGGFNYNDGVYTSTSVNSIAFDNKNELSLGTLTATMSIGNEAKDNGIIFGLTPNNTKSFWESGVSYYFFFISLSGTAYLGKVNDSSWEALAISANQINGYELGGTYTLKIERTQGTILCYVDDELYLSYEDDMPLTGTSYGIRAGGNNVSFKDISINNTGKIEFTEPTNYDVISGKLIAYSDTVIKATSNNTLAICKDYEGFSTLTSSVTLNIPSTGESGIVFGYSENSYYLFTVSSSLNVALKKVTNNIETIIKQTSLVAKYSTGSMVKLKVIVDDNNVYTYIDNVNLAMSKDLTPSGKVGVYASKSGTLFKNATSNAEGDKVVADVVIWGHSHMQLWDNYANDLKDYGTIVNMGIGGSNTPYWANLIDEVSSYEADTMIVMTGSNDIAGTKVNLIMEEEKAIYDKLRAINPNLKVILIDEFLQPCRLDYTSNVNELNQLYFEYEEENKDWLTVVDTYDIVLNEDGSLNEGIFRDIYHMTKEGYDILKERVIAALNGTYVFDKMTNYEIISGEYTYSNGKLICNSEGVALKNKANLTKGFVSTKLMSKEENTTGLIFSYEEDGSYYKLVINNNKLALYKEEALLKQEDIAINYNDYINLKAYVENGYIIAYVDDEEIFTYSDENPCQGTLVGLIGNKDDKFNGLTIEKVTNLHYEFTVGEEDDVEISTNEDGSYNITSKTSNVLMMFKDISFTDGTIEFDMKVNKDTNDHYWLVADGIVFAASSLTVDHNNGTYYVFGRCPWGSMTGYSKDTGDFRWEDQSKGKTDVAVGSVQHYKYVYIEEDQTVYIFVDDELVGTCKLSRSFHGSNVGVFFDTADCEITNLVFKDGVYDDPQIEENDNLTFTVGSAEDIEISKDKDGNVTYTSKVQNVMMMFNDIEFNGGTIEFDMTVNEPDSGHYCYVANGVIFGASGLDINHDNGNYYVFGRCPWGSMTGFSKSPDYLWEDVVKGKTNIAVGTTQHYAFVIDYEANTIKMYENGELLATNPLTRDFNGKYVGFYFASANTVVSNLVFKDGVYEI